MKTAPTPIIHSASTHSDAMNLMELLPETVCWILDGNYPESPGKLAVCM